MKGLNKRKLESILLDVDSMSARELKTAQDLVYGHTLLKQEHLSLTTAKHPCRYHSITYSISFNDGLEIITQKLVSLGALSKSVPNVVLTSKVICQGRDGQFHDFDLNAEEIS